MIRKNLLIFLLLPLTIFAQNIDHYETILQPGDSCSYIIPDAATATDWMQPEFNDSNWVRALGGIGFGDADDKTEIEKGVISLYIRYEFIVIDSSDIAALILDADYDDGFIAYLNGVEIARANIQDSVSWDMHTTGLHEAGLYSGLYPDRFEIDKSISTALLLNDTNVFAIQVQNENENSSDLSSNFFLHAGILSENNYYSEIPSWFDGPISYDEFNLPLMLIDTDGQEIPEEPRIVAQMKLINNSDGHLNKPEDEPNEYNGQINIERRGESSSGFAKKSYSIELQKSDSSNNNVSILGLPKENDFVLYGPYSDKTMLRNALTYQLYREMGRWAPRTVFFEMILNGEYNGIYLLTEKIKRDKNRVDIDKISKKDTTLIDLSGGYIFRRDKTNNLDPTEYWKSPVKQVYFEPLTYQYFYPEYKDLSPAQRQYPKDWMQKFDEMMSGNQFKNEQTGYHQYIDINSFRDMTILNEFSKSLDSYMFSTYFYKENDEDGGRLNAGPPWDYNISMGNIDYGTHHRYTYDWVYDNWSRVYWFKRLMEDPIYENNLFARWDTLRGNVYSEENIFSIIDSTVNHLGDAIERNFNRFPVLGKYVWPNQWFPDTYEEEIVLLKEWINGRLEWMDKSWANVYDPTLNNNIYRLQPTIHSFKIYPSVSDFSDLKLQLGKVQESTSFELKIINSHGQTVHKQTINIESTDSQVLELNNLSQLSNGIYLIYISDEFKTNAIQKIIKR